MYIRFNPNHSTDSAHQAFSTAADRDLLERLGSLQACRDRVRVGRGIPATARIFLPAQLLHHSSLQHVQGEEGPGSGWAFEG